MSFDVKKFSKAKFTARTETVAVPSLAAFFPEGEEPEFTIKGLTGEEWARVNEAREKAGNISAALGAISSRIQTEKVEALKRALALSDDMPADLVRRIEMLHLGCVEPKLDPQLAARIFEAAAIEGYELTNRITILSGQGMVLGESSASGKKKKSG